MRLRASIGIPIAISICLVALVGLYLPNTINQTSATKVPSYPVTAPLHTTSTPVLPEPSPSPSPSPIVIKSSPPLRLQIPIIGVDARTEAYTADDASKGVNGTTGTSCLKAGVIVCVDPPRADIVSWQVGGVAGVSYGAEPGTDSTENGYYFGHTFSGGSAVFNNLSQLKPGDEAFITTSNGVLRYVVQQLLDPAKDKYANEPLVRNQVAGRIILATCDHRPGAKTVNGGYATNNIVVILQLDIPTTR